MVVEHKIDNFTPDTSQVEYELIDQGKIYEGYSLRLLRQIRDLLLTMQAAGGNSTEFEHNIKFPNEQTKK